MIRSITHRTPGRSGISARFLSLPLGGNFPGAAVPGLSGLRLDEKTHLNSYTAASASHAPHESTWSLSNRMHTASGAVRFQPSAQPFGHAQELRCSPTKTVQAILKTQHRWGSGGCAES